MLHYLRIENLALMDSVSLEFEPGFVAVTGETGAGKSILLGALSLLSGARADKGLIREGADACEVEASLQLRDCARMDAALERLGLPRCEDGQLILFRSLHRSKAPRVMINGRLATVSNLQELGLEWIDFHGPGEPQKLFSEKWQLALLDLFARNDSALAEYAAGFRQWRDLLERMRQLRLQDQLGADEIDYLRGQIERIDRLDPSAESIATLERDHARLSAAQDLIEGAGEIEQALGGDDGVCDRLGRLLQRARELAALDPQLSPLADRIEALVIETSDLASEFERVRSDCEFDEETAADLVARMEDWLDVKRRYGGDVDVVRERRDRMLERLQSQGDIEGTLLRMEKDAATLQARLEKQAEALRESRVKAAYELARSAGALINNLGFKKARFNIEIERLPALAEHGNSECHFLFAPNAGQSLMPLNKIASSGEVARVMLALKAVLARVDHTPVLVFDEVDANVGGESARTVADELARLGAGGHQVFCITHLPQVAARAATHHVVTKTQTDDATRVTIEPLHAHPAARLEELARMLGDRKSKAARDHAAELLAAAPQPSNP